MHEEEGFDEKQLPEHGCAEGLAPRPSRRSRTPASPTHPADHDHETTEKRVPDAAPSQHPGSSTTTSLPTPWTRPRRGKRPRLSNVAFEVLDLTTIRPTGRSAPCFAFDAIHDQTDPACPGRRQMSWLGFAPGGGPTGLPGRIAVRPPRAEPGCAGRSRVAGRANQSVSPHVADTDGCLTAAGEPARLVPALSPGVSSHVRRSTAADSAGTATRSPMLVAWPALSPLRPRHSQRSQQVCWGTRDVT